MVRTQWTFITGGVRSGKSHFAEKQLLEIAALTKRNPYYVASGVAFDEEMQQRITRHKQDRLKESWITIEQPTAIAELVGKIPENCAVLWDCVTTWLTNELYVETTDGRMQWQNRQQFDKKVQQTKDALLALHEKNIPLVIVSNELLDEAASDYEEVRFYREQLGLFHQWLVANCLTAIEMDSSHPHYWKGGAEIE